MNTTLWNAGLFGGDGALIAERPVRARDLIYRALRTLQVLRAGMGPNADIVADGFEALNDLIDNWNTQKLLPGAVTRDVYDLSSLQMEYPIGADIRIRPQRVEAAGLLTAGGDEYEDPIEVLTDDPRHTGRPGVFWDGGWPGTIVISPEPTAGQQLVLYTWRQLQRFESLELEYAFPPGFSLALRLNLAVALGPELLYAMKNPADLDEIRRQAFQSKKDIARVNTIAKQITSDAGALGGNARGCGYRMFP